MSAAGAPNDAGDKTGGINRLFTRIYKIRLRGKELKKRNRKRYYLEKVGDFRWFAGDLHPDLKTAAPVGPPSRASSLRQWLV